MASYTSNSRSLSFAPKIVDIFTCITCCVVFSFFPMSSIAASSLKLPLTESNSLFTSALVPAVIKRGEKYRMEFPYFKTKAISQSKIINDVRSGALDMFWGLSTPEYEEEFQAVFIPLYRGILGMRIAVVKRENQNLLADVQTVEQLAQFKAGQGTLWADTKILEANGLNVVKEMKWSNMYRMLWAERFDYFPRGIQEPWRELEQNAQLNLVIDPHLLIWYKVPYYIFVRKDNVQLAEHLRVQLEEMIADGSFNELFFMDPDIKLAIEKANLSKRKVIKLDNPLHSPDTPYDRHELWFSPSELSKPKLAEASL